MREETCPKRLLERLIAVSFCLLAAAGAAFAQEGHITKWEISGPYTQEGKDGPALFDVVFSPETPGDKSVKWRPVTGATVDLAQLIGGENRVAYLRAGVSSPKPQKARLEIGSDDGVKVWLNGKLVHANNASRGVTPGQDKVDVMLKQGVNTLLLKINQGGGGWGACARLAASGGGELAAASAKAGPDTGIYSPSLEEIYQGYNPSFSEQGRRAMAGHGGEGLRNEMKFSRQKHFMNIGDVKIDAQVWPIIKKANETMDEKKEYRKATEYYRRILQEYPDDLVQIADEGVFVPAVLYVQRRILTYPKKELTYYRILYDPAAKEIFERALKRYSIFDYKDLVRFHLATSYGDDALFALGNDALDKGKYKEGRRYYERIVTYHGLKDEDRDSVNLDRDQVWVRLAICYRHLGRNEEFEAAVKRVKNRKEETVARLLKQLETLKYDEFAVRQREGRRSARYEAADDKDLSDPLPYTFSANTGEWRVPLTGRNWALETEALPWVTETDMIYKDMNVVYSRSILTGELNWVFGPGGVSLDWDHNPGGAWGGPCGPNYYPQQAVLVQDGTVFANMFVYGPSLVAVDQHTGRLLWAKGPMAAQTEDEWLDRYQCSPAGSRGVVIAPVVHDDIRGRAHISSTAELAAFQSRTGKLLWRTSLGRISPLKITQSRYPRKIRILSTTPLVKEGVVYHVTDAGIIGAVDVETGGILWLTRYPQNKKVLDNFSNPGRIWRNEAPLIRGNKLYVTPVDTGLLLCLNTETGRVLWTSTQNTDANWWRGHGGGAKGYPHMMRMNGFTSDGLLALSWGDMTFLSPDTGQLVWRARLSREWLEGGDSRGKVLKLVGKPPKGLEPAINGEGNDFWWGLGVVASPPTLARNGKVHFSMRSYDNNSGGIFYSEYCLDLKERGLTDQRRWFQGVHNDLPVAKQVVNEEPEIFKPAQRMTFKRWGVDFEADMTTEHIVVRYDRKKLDEALAKDDRLETLFGKAEIARKRREIKEAIRLYESCKPLLPSEEEDRRKNINLRLYPLYTELARWGHQSADLAFLEDACKKMGATASNPTQEIRALLAYAELHAKKGDWDKAVQVLQNASRHYWREPIMVSGLEVGNREKLTATALKSLENVLGEIPAPYADVAKQFYEAEKASLDDYFLAVANVDEDYAVETRSLISKRLKDLLARAPKEYREQYEKQAGKELEKYESVEVGERLLWCWPESEAARKKIRELAAKTASLKPVERQSRLWRFGDLAEACGLGNKLVTDGKKGLALAPSLSTMSQGAGAGEVEAKNVDPDMVRLVLPQKGQTQNTAQFLFVGGRKKRAYGNRFTILCWNMKENKKEWISREILLHGKMVSGEGYEVGFEEVFIHGNLAIVHGQHDVIAIDRTPGADLDQKGKKEKKWHFRVPLGFKIRSVDMCGDVLVLCGRGSTVAISPITGEIIWDDSEIGEFYAGPFFHKDTMLTVRQSPAEVSFRKVGTGRLLCRLSLPGLTTNKKHPVYALEGGGQSPAAAAAAQAYPVAFAEGLLALSDGLTYHVVDCDKRQLRWSRAATKLDMSQDASYRMWINGNRLLVLKPYYAVLENAVMDLASGDMLWRRREGGRKMDAKLKKFETQDATGGKAATGLVLSSMVFVDGTAYGIKYEMGASTVTLVGLDPKTGNETMSIREKGYDDAEAYVEPSWSKGCVAVRIQDGNKFEVWQVDVKAKKLVKKIRLEGYGRLGEYGDASAVWQGPYQAIWAYEKRKVAGPGM